MSSRWSLSNRFKAISYDQAGRYVAEFKSAAEESFGTECVLDITLMSANKVYTTFWDEDLQASLDATNASNTILRTNDHAQVTPELWDQAAYVEVGVRPADPSKATESYAFGHVEFKGSRPRQATFYIQPDGEGVMQQMLAKKAFGVAAGDGYDSNGENSGFVPMSVARIMPSSLMAKMGVRPFNKDWF